MLNDDVKAYLIVLAAERCPHEEFVFQSKILYEFTSLVGNIPFDELRLSHLLAFDAIKGRLTTERGPEWEIGPILDPLYGLHSFIVWRRAQTNDQRKRIQKISSFFF